MGLCIKLCAIPEGVRYFFRLQVAKGDLPLIDFLIEEGSKLDAIDKYGLTPLGEVLACRIRPYIAV